MHLDGCRLGGMVSRQELPLAVGKVTRLDSSDGTVVGIGIILDLEVIRLASECNWNPRSW